MCQKAIAVLEPQRQAQGVQFGYAMVMVSNCNDEIGKSCEEGISGRRKKRT